MATNNSIDRIADVFNGRTIFISGATGFVGKALVEKLLRSANVKKIYVLIRKKRGKSGTARFEEFFNNALFKKLLSLKPDAPKKCVPIEGDVSEVDLGISPTDRKTLINEVNFIYHGAATIKFDETISYALKMNTRGTKYMLDLAEQCKQLQLFVYLSTAYAFTTERKTLEKEYKPILDPHEVLNGLSWIQEDALEVIKKKLLGNIPNTYAFSKSLAEALVYEKVGKMPVMICRLAVVIPSLEDPFTGWFNNLQGAMGLLIAAGKGVLRCMYMDSNSYANLIPVDSTVSSLMVLSWHYLKTKNSPYIINVCTPHTDIRKSWEEVLNLGRETIETRAPFNGILWYPGGTMTKSRLYNQINFIFFQLIPAIFIDALLFILGYKPILYNIQMRIRKGAEMFEFYTTKPWDFETTNIETIREKLTDSEKKTYILKPEKIDLNEYMYECIMSCRRNYLKETDDMLPAAKRNMKIMYCLDIFFKIGFFALLAYYIFYKLKECFSLKQF